MVCDWTENLLPPSPRCLTFWKDPLTAGRTSRARARTGLKILLAERLGRRVGHAGPSRCNREAVCCGGCPAGAFLEALGRQPAHGGNDGAQHPNSRLQPDEHQGSARYGGGNAGVWFP